MHGPTVAAATDKDAGLQLVLIAQVADGNLVNVGAQQLHFLGGARYCRVRLLLSLLTRDPDRVLNTDKAPSDFGWGKTVFSGYSTDRAWFGNRGHRREFCFLEAVGSVE